MRYFPALVAAAAFVVAAVSVPSAEDLLHRANALQQLSPLIDGHNDYPWALRELYVERDLDKLDIRRVQRSLHTDIPRLRQGGVGGQFWSVYVPATMQGQEAVRATLEQIDVVHRMMSKYRDTFTLARTAADVEQIFKMGKIASLIGMEGGYAIDNSLGALRMFFAMGARYMTLTHNVNIPWADSGTDTPRVGGLTKFGEEVVREMNRLGMLVDLSHVAPQTMKDALAVTQAPVIFSHSSARALLDHPRDVPDDVLTLVAKNQGVVMVNGNRYSKGLALQPLSNGVSQVTYRLSRQYSVFKATVAIEDTPKKQPSVTPLTFVIVADGKVRWTSQQLQKSGQSQECSLNIRGVNTLTLQVQCSGPNNRALAVWVDPNVSK